MSLDSQFEQKLFKVLGRALEDPTFADALMEDPSGALSRAGMAMPQTDAAAARDFVGEMIVAKQETSPAGDTTFIRSVFAPGGKPGDLQSTHGDVHGDGHGDVTVGKMARLEALRLGRIR